MEPVDEASVADASRWVVFYPAYIDAQRSQADGRRVAQRVAVTHPTAAEVARVCEAVLGLRAVLEAERQYPRDFFNKGRVRVRLYDEDRQLVDERVASRTALYRRVAAEVTRLRASQAAAQAGHADRTHGAHRKKGKRH